MYKIVFRFSVFMCQFTFFANKKIRQSEGTKLVVAHKYNHKLTKENYKPVAEGQNSKQKI